jgi:hypothetical protein
MATRNPYAEHQPSVGGGSYYKFEDKKTLVCRIVSDPAIFESEYQGRLSTKYAWLIYNINEEEVQIMQLPKTGYRALAAIAADPEYGNPMENPYVVKITRTGQKQQTKYDTVPSPKKFEITDEIQEEINNIDLIERLKASDYNQNVAWLLDEIDGNREKATEPKNPVKKDDVVIEDVSDEPINLDDIPY